MEIKILNRERFIRRAENRLEKVEDLLHVLGLKEFYLCGGGLLKEVNDLDIFPTNVNEYKRIVVNIGNKKSLMIGNGRYQIVSKTANAITFVDNDDNVVQICKYTKPSLKELVESFDFAHCQIGTRVSLMGNTVYMVQETYYTKEFVQSMTEEGTTFVGSEYPLSSLMRVFKYKERGLLPGRQEIMEVIKIMNRIIERGFKDYVDFKDQMDAVDLGLLPEELEELDSAELTRLFDNLKK